MLLLTWLVPSDAFSNRDILRTIYWGFMIYLVISEENVPLLDIYSVNKDVQMLSFYLVSEMAHTSFCHGHITVIYSWRWNMCVHLCPSTETFSPEKKDKSRAKCRNCFVYKFNGETVNPLFNMFYHIKVNVKQLKHCWYMHTYQQWQCVTLWGESWCTKINAFAAS